MAAISATYSFTPTLPSGPTGNTITVTGNTESEVKAAVKAQLAARRTTQAAQLAAVDAADAAMDG